MENTIKATADVGRLLTKVDRLFDASPRTVFGELLQNARRAGATQIRFDFVTATDLPGTEDDTLVTVADNGRGIEDPQVLLNLASEGWDASTEADEDPAGMGFFSLSNFDDVAVYSRDWFISISQAGFRGLEDVKVRRVPKPLDEGTRMNWWWRDIDPRKLREELKAAAKYCGLEQVIIKVEDAEPEEMKPGNYLDGHKCVEVFKDKGYSLAINEASNSTGTSTFPPRVWINFWGTEITTALPDECRILGKVQVSVRVDVWRTGSDDLRLVLPARNAVIHNTRLLQLMEDCEHKIYEYVHKERYGKHTLPYAGYRRAGELGYDIGEAKLVPSFYDNTYVGGSDQAELLKRLVILGKGWGQFRYVRSLFDQARDEGQHKLHAMKPNADMEGYTWYDAMRVVSDVVIEIDGVKQDPDEFFVPRSDHRDDGQIIKFATEIAVTYVFSDGSELTFNPEAVVAGDQVVSEWDSVDEDTEIFVLASAQEDDVIRDDAVSLIYRTLFVHDFGGDSESLDVQEEEFDRNLRYAMLEACCSDLAAARWELEQALKRFWAGRDDRFTWWVRFSGRGSHREPKVLNFRHWSNEEQHKLVATIPRNSDGTVYQLFSESEITPQRAERYLVWEHEHDAAEDGMILDIAGDPVDLDEWEAKMKNQGIDVNDNPPPREEDEDE